MMMAGVHNPIYYSQQSTLSVDGVEMTIMFLLRRASSASIFLSSLFFLSPAFYICLSSCEVYTLIPPPPDPLPPPPQIHLHLLPISFHGQVIGWKENLGHFLYLFFESVDDASTWEMADWGGRWLESEGSATVAPRWCNSVRFDVKCETRNWKHAASCWINQWVATRRELCKIGTDAPVVCSPGSCHPALNYSNSRSIHCQRPRRVIIIWLWTRLVASPTARLPVSKYQ